jgi:hypothetical protein
MTGRARLILVPSSLADVAIRPAIVWVPVVSGQTANSRLYSWSAEALSRGLTCPQDGDA